MLSIHAILLIGIAASLAPTMDEPHHLAGGLRVWSEGRFDVDRGNPPLVGCLAASVVYVAGVELDWSGLPSSFKVGTDLMDANPDRAVWLVMLGRLACVPISVLGGYLVWRFTRSLYGIRAGLLSVTLWCFCPQVLAHGSLITSDMASAVGCLAFVMSVRLWLSDGTGTSVIAMSVALGLALLSKYVCLVLVPIGLLIWWFDRWWHQRLTKNQTLRDLGDGAVVAIVALNLVNIGYAYSGTGLPLSAFEIGQSIIQSVGTAEGTWWREALESVPVPLPADYVRGIDEINAFHNRRPPTYFGGEFGAPRWYFYLAGFALKLPSGLLVLGMLTLVARFVCGPRLDDRDIVLLVPGIVILVFVSCVTKAQFLRYALPVLPFALVWIGQFDRLRIPHFRQLGTISMVWIVFSSLAIWPNSLAHFNEFAGGADSGHEWMLDSSSDWGQDLLALREWYEQHTDRRPFYLAYFGKVDPLDVGIQYQLPPILPKNARSELKLKPGWYAVSAVFLHGYEWIDVPDGNGGRVYPANKPWTYFLKMTAQDRAGNSILIYQVSE